MRSLSLRSGNSPTTPYGGRVNGLQILGSLPPCHPNYRALALTPAGLSPAERASLCWTHVGSRTGAPTVGSGGKSNHFRVGPQSGSHNHVSQPPPPQTQHAVFPHYAFLPASRQGLCGLFSLRLHVYLSPQVVQFDRRLSHLASASHVVKVVTDSRAASLHRRYPASQVLPAPPPPSRLSADFPVLPVIRPTFAPPISQRGEEGFSSCLARPRHRTVATTPPECRSASASLRYAMLLSSKT